VLEEMTNANARFAFIFVRESYPSSHYVTKARTSMLALDRSCIERVHILGANGGEALADAVHWP
jgi:hypothetical protein